MPQTIIEKLAAVQAAITAAENNQSYTLNGRSVTRANLKTLYEERRQLQKEYNRELGLKPRVAKARPGGAFE